MGFEAIKGYFKQNRMFYLFVAPLFGTYRNHIMARARRRQGIDDNLVVFSSFDFRSYNDNPRYISEKLHELRPETDIVWLFRDKDAARKKFDIPPYVRALNSIDRDGVEAQAKQALENVKAILAEAGLEMSSIIKTLVFIKDMNDFGKVNAIYAQYINGDVLPARSCVEVAALPKGGLVEIEVIAKK